MATRVILDRRTKTPRDELRIVRRPAGPGDFGPTARGSGQESGQESGRKKKREKRESGRGRIEASSHGVPTDDDVFGPHVGGCQLFGGCARLRSLETEEMLGIRDLKGLDLGRYMTFRPGETRFDRSGASRLGEFAQTLSAVWLGLRPASEVLTWLEADGRLKICLYGVTKAITRRWIDETLRDHGMVRGRTPGRCQAAAEEVDRREPERRRRGLSCPDKLGRGSPIWPDYGWPPGEGRGCLWPEKDRRGLWPVESVFSQAARLRPRTVSESGFGRQNVRQVEEGERPVTGEKERPATGENGYGPGRGPREKRRERGGFRKEGKKERKEEKEEEKKKRRERRGTGKRREP